MCSSDLDGAGVTLHDGAILTGGQVPAHVPGAYPRLSCCGGPVQLVPVRHDPYGPVPIPAPLETDAREDAVCPVHGPNLYTCPEGCAFAAAFPDNGPAEPVIPDGPGWYGHGPNGDDQADAAFASVYLEPSRSEHTRAELYLRLTPHDDSEPREAGAELTLGDLEELAIRICEIGMAAATADGLHFHAEAFERARENLSRVADAVLNAPENVPGLTVPA
jgi:hypothetical protein